MTDKTQDEAAGKEADDQQDVELSKQQLDSVDGGAFMTGNEPLKGGSGGGVITSGKKRRGGNQAGN